MTLNIMRLISQGAVCRLLSILALSLASAQARQLPTDLVPIAPTDIAPFVCNYQSLQKLSSWPPLPFNWLSDQTNVPLYVSPSQGASVIFVGDQSIDYAQRAAKLRSFAWPRAPPMTARLSLATMWLMFQKTPGAGAYLKLGTRKALEIALVNAASFLELAPDGSINRPGWPWERWPQSLSWPPRRPRSWKGSNPKIRTIRFSKKPPGRRLRIPSPLPTIVDQRITAGTWWRF